MTQPEADNPPGQRHDDFARCRCWVRGPKDPEPRIEVAPPHQREPNPEIEALWESKRTANPRLFNGPILAFHRFDEFSFTIHTRRDEFKYLTVQPTIDNSLKHIGVTGVVIARDTDNKDHVLVAQRSHQTRIYGGMWELAPSGGVDPPPMSQDHLDMADLWQSIRNELTEELALPVDPDPGPAVAFAEDPIGMSFEVIIRINLTPRVEELIATTNPDAAGPRSSNWEYDATRWIAVDEIPKFDNTLNTRIIPPTRALFRALGWI